METISPVQDVAMDHSDCSNVSPQAEMGIKKLMSAYLENIVASRRSLEDASNTLTINCIEMTRLRQRVQLLRKEDWDGGPVRDCQRKPHRDLQTEMKELKSEGLQMIRCVLQSHLDVRRRTTELVQKWMEQRGALQNDLNMAEQSMRTNDADKINFYKLQDDSEYLMEVAWSLRENLKITKEVCEKQALIMGHHSAQNHVVHVSEFTQMIDNLTSEIKKLAQDTFLVITQPCQVVKIQGTSSKVYVNDEVKVRLLTAKKLNLHINIPTVSVSIVDEETCRTIHSNGVAENIRKDEKAFGRLIPTTARINTCRDTKCSTALFRQLSLKDFSFRDHAFKGPVAERKYSLLFRLDFKAGDIEFKIWRLSLPIVAVTHWSQECLAQAVVSWDNAFSQSQSIPFQLPEYVQADGVTKMLNNFFRNTVGTDLKPENIDCLHETLSSLPGYPDQLTWNAVCKSNLTGKNFTYWQWFYEGTMLIQKHFKDAWRNGHFTGFITKKLAEELLTEGGCLPGTFVLRFSESLLGGISISWIHTDGKVYHKQPQKGRDVVENLMEQLRWKEFCYVYPNTDKDIAFKRAPMKPESIFKGQVSQFSDLELLRKCELGSTDTYKEIKKEDIEIGALIGQGQFSTIRIGTLNKTLKVAVRAPNSNCRNEFVYCFLNEINIRSFLQSHPNTVSFLGAYTKDVYSGFLYIVNEFCENGSLDSHLRKRKSKTTCNETNKIDQYTDDSGYVTYIHKRENLTAVENEVDLNEFCRFSYEIASGMEYIASKRIVHCDLAARSVLLDGDLRCKIGDFHMARQLPMNEDCFEEKELPRPWKWMAPESIEKSLFTSKSDIWSFGVTIWEIYSLGEQPYPEESFVPDFHLKLQNGLRLPKPDISPEEIYKKMLDCWQLSPENRPSFTDMANYFGNIPTS